MKTVIKYELVINEALRSALNYHKPEEQINEFISFFGKHIGCDRMYIFEDCDERHATDNTYEWCADGVAPEIDELQNVDMDAIDWWYEAFKKNESIIIQDVEAIKDTHRFAYDLLSHQKVKRLVVCPFRYKDEIKGFFGVDNPPESDTLGLTTFLDMIATLVVSLLKLRNTFNRSNREAMLSSYSSLSKIYISMHLVNIQTGKYHIIKTTDMVLDFMDRKPRNEGEYEIADDFHGHIKKVMRQFCSGAQLDEALEFVDINTVEQRIAHKNTIVHEFIGLVTGWCRERFIPVDYDEDGSLLHVLYCVENIDEEKKRENKLFYLAETDLMTGICNRGSGEYKISAALENKMRGLLCLIDCDKFKLVNDTYGHAVGDKVIIALAETLKNSCRDNDIVLRLGGDEFAAFIPGMADEKMARSFFSRLFENIEKIEIPELGGQRIVISLGSCFYTGEEAVSFDELYRKADTAMYESKKVQGYSATIYGIDKIIL